MSGQFNSYTALTWTIQQLKQSSPLAALAPGDIWEAQAPRGAGTPLVIVTHVAAEDKFIMVGGARLYTSVLLQVMAQAQTNGIGPLAPIVATIDAVLNNRSGTRTGAGAGEVYWSKRERELILPPFPDDQDPDVTYRAAGGEYRIYASAA